MLRDLILQLLLKLLERLGVLVDGIGRGDGNTPAPAAPIRLTVREVEDALDGYLDEEATTWRAWRRRRRR